MAAQQTPWTTVEEYLKAERAAEFRSEYLNGHIYAMAGGTPAHSMLIASMSAELVFAVRQRAGCRVFVTDLRLRVAPEGLYTYPDVMVICGDIQYAGDQKDIVTNPVLIVEVLSKSTEGYDRGEKFAQYRRVGTLQEYVLVAQERARIEKYLRQPDGTWNYSSVEGLDAVVDLASLNCQVQLANVYRDVPGVEAS